MITFIKVFAALRDMDMLPAYDNHFHMSPAGRNLAALKEFEAAGGTGITLVTLPYAEVPIREGADFARSYEITFRLAERARAETGLLVNVAVGPYPILLIGLAERYGLPQAESILMKGMDDAARAVAEGRAVALGEIGRPHFECSAEIWDASNRILLHGMELARDQSCPVIIHCESGTTETNRSLAALAKEVRLDPALVVKHSSPPFVTPAETYGVTPSLPASKTFIKTAFAKGTDRFLLETDFIDDPTKPGAIMAATTVPNKVKWMVASGTATPEQVVHICQDLPEQLYRR
ncbi:MAG: TatD family hydrolase [Methanomethylophilus sp.]|nr:TatD family hydrolase [Methanomethylophilus sp.]